MINLFTISGRLDKYPQWEVVKVKKNGDKVWQYNSLLTIRLAEDGEKRITIPFIVRNSTCQKILTNKSDENNSILASGYFDKQKNGDLIWIINEVLPFHPTKFKRDIPDYRKLTAEMYACSSQKLQKNDYGELWIVNCISVSCGKLIRVRLACPMFNEKIVKGTHLLVHAKITKFGKKDLTVFAYPRHISIYKQEKRTAKEVFSEINTEVQTQIEVLEHDTETGTIWV